MLSRSRYVSHRLRSTTINRSFLSSSILLRFRTYDKQRRTNQNTNINSRGLTSSSLSSSSKRGRLPQLESKDKHKNEFFNSTVETDRVRSRQRQLATNRKFQLAFERVIEPPTLHLLAASAFVTLVVGGIEGTLLCQQWPFFESLDAGKFIVRYSFEQLFPSVVWETQDASLVANALGLDASELFRNEYCYYYCSPTTASSPVSLGGDSAASAASSSLLLKTKLLVTMRHFTAGFMMIAQLVRAATVTMESWNEYEKRIDLGREPPLPCYNSGGLVVRLCGRDSYVSEVSMKRMGIHFFPIFEDPERVQNLVWKHSSNQQSTSKTTHHRHPVYWCVQPGQYGSPLSWNKFPASTDAFLRGGKNSSDHILVLEADATNGDDPLSIGEMALDLTIDEASQGFRRIVNQYTKQGLIDGKDYRTLRVYLGNSMETHTTGGGYTYTIRHRFQYAKEMDVLIDSRAPVLRKILEWCERATKATEKAGEGNQRKIFFQTSSREYFLNLQRVLKQHGYEIYDPLDLRMLQKMRDETASSNKNRKESIDGNDGATTAVAEEDISSSSLFPSSSSNSFLEVLLGDPKWSFLNLLGQKQSPPPNEDDNSKMLRVVAKLAKLPRLVHFKTTAETVNAIEALVMAGELGTNSSCCALIDQQEGVQILEETLKEVSGFVQATTSQKHGNVWRRKQSIARTSEMKGIEEEHLPPGNITDGSCSSNGLEIICSARIHDDILRDVRLWARMGYSADEIQREIDEQFQEMILQSHSVQREVNSAIKDPLSLEQAHKMSTTTSAPLEEKVVGEERN